uniref:HIG1 domain-containing protein n=1 Tax=Macrostomum lignano TaxID=282301 RepID=A0A1I8FR02_9PLAT
CCSAAGTWGHPVSSRCFQPAAPSSAAAADSAVVRRAAANINQLQTPATPFNSGTKAAVQRFPDSDAEDEGAASRGPSAAAAAAAQSITPPPPPVLSPPSQQLEAEDAAQEFEEEIEEEDRRRHGAQRRRGLGVQRSAPSLLQRDRSQDLASKRFWPAALSQLLEAFKTGAVPPGTTTRDLWEAQKVKDAILHPDTGEKIYRPFRMSGFVPYGTPIVPPVAHLNYANRNASKETPVSRFLTGYVGAVSAAVSIAVGLTVVIRKANTLPPATKNAHSKVRAATSSTASTLNVLLMRNSELSEGIEVFDENRQVVGTSKVAAKRALFDTAKTRAILPVPLLLIPPLVMTFLEKRSFLRRFPRLHLPVHALVVTGCLWRSAARGHSTVPAGFGDRTQGLGARAPSYGGARLLQRAVLQQGALNQPE